MRRAYANILRKSQQKDKNNANDEVHEKSNTSQARKRGKLDAFLPVKACSGMPRASIITIFFLILFCTSSLRFHLYEERREIILDRNLGDVRIVPLFRNLSISCRAFLGDCQPHLGK